MAITSSGFDGTMNEQQLSRLLLLAGVRHAVGSLTDFAATAVNGLRSVAIAAGEAYTAGVVTTSTASEVLALPVPSAGAWHLIVLRRTWATNTTQLLTIAGGTTSTTTPTAPPATLPTMSKTHGVEDDQPLYWAWVSNSTSSVVLFDIRDLTVDARLAKVAGGVSGEWERNRAFPSAVQGDRVYRKDRGWEEAYFGLYNATSNRGGATPAGWYPVGGAMPMARYEVSNFTIPASNEIEIAGGDWTQVEDRPGWRAASGTNYRLRPNIPGYYQVDLRARFPSVPSGFRMPSVRVSGSNDIGKTIKIALIAAELGGAESTVSGLMFFDGVTDFASIYIWQNSGAQMTQSRVLLTLTFVRPLA